MDFRDADALAAVAPSGDADADFVLDFFVALFSADFVDDVVDVTDDDVVAVDDVTGDEDFAPDLTLAFSLTSAGTFADPPPEGAAAAAVRASGAPVAATGGDPECSVTDF